MNNARNSYLNNSGPIEPLSDREPAHYERRADSSRLVELHIYVMPRDFWITKQKLAYNEAISESVSAGFIRVTKETNLFDLRNEIKKQCSREDITSDYYVFLRSVGRALTRIKPNQEYELKVKNFLPPQTIGPEIFLLQIDKDISQTLLKKFDGVRDGSNVPGTDTRMFESPNDSHNGYLFDKDHVRDDDSRRKTVSQNYYYNDAEKIREFNKLKEEQERLKNRQADLERMRKLQMEQLKNHQQQQNEMMSRFKINQIDEQEHESDNYYSNNGSRQPGREGKTKNAYDLNDNHNSNHHHANDLKRLQQLQNGTKNSNPNDQQDSVDRSAVIIQSAYRGYKDRKNIKDLQNKGYENFHDASMNGYSKQNEGPVTVNGLKEKMNATKEKRLELERLRDDLIKHLKQIHNRINVRRKEARDLWKKKYFAEKKKTPNLEDRMNSLLNEIESSQKKMFHSLENDVKNAASIGYNKESDIKRNWLVSLKLQEETYLLKRQLDQLKLKLTTDLKLRNQAENESKALKNELAQTKMNLNELRN